MKKLLMMTFAMSLGTGISLAGTHRSDVLGGGSPSAVTSENIYVIEEEEARDNADMNTRTMKANHATTTASPAYADEELERYRAGKGLSPRDEEEREEARDFDDDSYEDDY